MLGLTEGHKDESDALLEEMARELASAYLSKNTSARNGRAKTYFYVEDKESYDMPQDDLFFTTYGHALPVNATGESDQSEVCYWARYSEEREELVLLSYYANAIAHLLMPAAPPPRLAPEEQSQ